MRCKTCDWLLYSHVQGMRNLKRWKCKFLIHLIFSRREKWNLFSVRSNDLVNMHDYTRTYSTCKFYILHFIARLNSTLWDHSVTLVLNRNDRTCSNFILGKLSNPSNSIAHLRFKMAYVTRIIYLFECNVDRNLSVNLESIVLVAMRRDPKLLELYAIL